MCFGPSTLGAGAKTRLESRIKEFTPHCVCTTHRAQTNDIVMIYPAMRMWGSTEQEHAGCWDGYACTRAVVWYGCTHVVEGASQAMGERDSTDQHVSPYSRQTLLKQF